MRWKGGRCNWVLIGSGLSAEEREALRSFAEVTRAKLCHAWDSSITHVICGVDEDGCAK